MLTNLVTLLHNYVSHEFVEAKKPFCECVSVCVCVCLCVSLSLCLCVCVPDALRLVRMRTHVSRWV